MDHAFWNTRWAENRIGFHQSDFNRMLVAHFGALGLTTGSRVFVPLCGKTRDIAWLLKDGMQVAGAELNRMAAPMKGATLCINGPAGPSTSQFQSRPSPEMISYSRSMSRPRSDRK